jgi:hypothetical protein
MVFFESSFEVVVAIYFYHKEEGEDTRSNEFGDCWIFYFLAPISYVDAVK